MGVRFYDEALLQKIKNWAGDTQATILGVNQTKQFFETYLDEHHDNNIKLPLIALSRSGGYTIANKNKQAKTYSGSALMYNKDISVTLNAIPIEVAYQLDIYTRYLDEADEYARNFVFNLINYPRVQIEIPYESCEFKHDCSIHITSEVEDNSSIAERLIPGQFTRFTIGFQLVDAYLFDTQVKQNPRIIANLANDIIINSGE